MKTWIQILMCAVVGFVGAILVIKGFKLFDFTHYADAIVIGILVIILILFVLSAVLYRQIKALQRKVWDEVSVPLTQKMDVIYYFIL
ncbi:hypothetical protein R4Z09_13875 [Niallia oryzisoli]|uniref:Uncharacterized protein n=1 Tax=Niallia oryzisoli TaxID=1737571 RepID=A0ABZ2CNN9_9BACI